MVAAGAALRVLPEEAGDARQPPATPEDVSSRGIVSGSPLGSRDLPSFATIVAEIPGAARLPNVAATRLAAAILERAILDAAGETSSAHVKPELVQEDACRWIATDHGAPFDFASCCTILGIDAAAARLALTQHRHQP